MDFPIQGENQHLVQINIQVLPEFRRQGYGTRLLAVLVENTRALHRRSIVAVTEATAPAGEIFLEKLGARRAGAAHVNQLDLVDVDRELLRHWQERARERAAGFDIVFWEGQYPETELEGIAQAKGAMNQAPRDDLEIEDFAWTPERLREFNRTIVQSSLTFWFMAARERATGNLAGFTEMFWFPSRPAVAQQRDTGVLQKYRNLGLGRWLKAAMLEKVLDQRPETRVIRTSNADSNAPMLKINAELGFKPHRANTAWQVETEQVLAVLSQRHGDAKPRLA